MYSGITRGLFDVVAVDNQPGLTKYVVKLNDELIRGVEIGASINIDGVCQSVIHIHQNEVTFQAIAETLQRTTLNELFVGRKVSVEKSLCYGDVVGGHELAGHVIGTATVVEVQRSENNVTLKLQCPKDWLKCIFMKGFIAVEGSSLTVGEINHNEGTFNIHLIPETIKVTNFGNKKVGDKVNIELDYKTQVIVQTVERVLHENRLLGVAQA